MSDAPLLFLATPLHDGRVHQAYMSGVIELAHALPGRLIIGKFSGSFLPVSRDVLTAHFLRSNATHLLCVDSDIGFTAADVQKLLDAKQDFATGLYAKKTTDRLLATPLQIVALVGSGVSLKEIGTACGCLDSTVRTHLRRISTKLDCAGTREILIQLFSFDA